MCEIGDAVVHPKNDAGIIAGLQTIGKSPGWCDYYKIEIIGRVNATLMAPTTQAEELGVRHAISAPQLAGVQYAGSRGASSPHPAKKLLPRYSEGISYPHHSF